MEWEYDYIVLKGTQEAINSDLDVKGKQGWELVSIVNVTAPRVPNTISFHAFFKKEVNESPTESVYATRGLRTT